MTTYLAGPINQTTDEEALSWRETAHKALNGDVLDPMARDYRGKEDESVSEIVSGDKEDILNCDRLLAYCWQPSVGTSMEIYFAWDHRIPVIVVVPKGLSVSPWLRYHCDALFRSLEEALAFIRESEA